MTPKKNPIRDAALAYGKAGRKIYPSPRKDGPAYVKWKEASTSDAATITQWWTRWPDALICLDCGKSEIGVIDVDTLEGHNVDGITALLDLELDNEALPETREAGTPSTGKHLFFRDPGAKLKTTSGKLGVGLDTRGRGGMVVLTPSVVKGKGAYSWLNKKKLALIPQWVLDLVGAPNDYGTAPDAEFEPAYTEEGFKEVLNLLNVDDFSDHDKWLTLMLACTHSSTVLDGEIAFMDWTTGNGNGEYAGDFDLILNRWKTNYNNSRNKSGKGAAKVGTFNNFLIDAGFGDRVRHAPQTSAAEDFDDDDDDEPDEAAAGKADTTDGRWSTPKIDLEKVKRTIRKLLKKTTAAGCTAEEAASSLAKARELMSANGLTEDDLKKKKKEPPPTTAKMDDFLANLKEGNYIFIPTRETWPKSTIESILGPAAAAVLDRTRHVAIIAWCPGDELWIKDKLLVKGGWIVKAGSNTFNNYIAPPTLKAGDASKATPWVDHMNLLFPTDADHIIKVLAHKVRFPGIKINHGLIMGSDQQGIGKDMLLEAIVRILGEWNVKDVTATEAMDASFNPHLESLMCRISEANDLGDDDKYSFYNRRKTWMVSPPKTISVRDKHVKAHPVMNVTLVVISSNDKSGLYIDKLDRRDYVAWSDCKQKDFTSEFFTKFFAWYDDGGVEHVYAYLMSVDLSGFDPKAPPPKTAAWKEIVNSDQSTETTQLDDLIDDLDAPWSDERPAVFTIKQLTACASSSDAYGRFDDVLDLLTDKRQTKSLSHKLSRSGYQSVQVDDDVTDGRWRVAGDRVVIYGRTDLSMKDRRDAASALVEKLFVSQAEEKRKYRAARKAEAARRSKRPGTATA